MRELRDMFCPRCKAGFVVPLLSLEEKTHAAELVRGNKPMQAIAYLREISGIELRDAKAIRQHIPEEKGVCSRCGTQIGELDEAICLSCRSLNLNW